MASPVSSPGDEYPDGMNYYGYVQNNPTNTLDPFGLDSYNPYDDWVDDEISDLTGHKLYALGMLNEGAKWASLGLTMALEIGFSLLPGAGLYDAWKAIDVIRNGGGGFWEVMDIVSVAIPALAVAGDIIGDIRAIRKMKQYCKRGCSCFIAGTLVVTLYGDIPIESVQVGDQVLTRPDTCPGDEPIWGEVTDIFVNCTEEVLWLTFEDGDVVGTTPGHQVWTFESGWILAGDLEVGESFIDVEGQPEEIVDIVLDPTPSTVYNIEVGGTFTYFVGDVWVHNNSCPDKNWVYRAKDSADNVIYVGITNNFARREAEHLRQRGFQIVELLNDLSRVDARAVEETLIVIHELGKEGGTLFNKIHSISIKNPNRGQILERGYELLLSIGYAG